MGQLNSKSFWVKIPFIVDGKGVIHYRLAGDVNERVWNETLKPIYDKLAEKP